jgi:hypothetical protein
VSVAVDLALVVACLVGIALCGPTRYWPNPTGPGWVLLASGRLQGGSCSTWASSPTTSTTAGC